MISGVVINMEKRLVLVNGSSGGGCKIPMVAMTEQNGPHIPELR